jgi:hypothetical protein
VAGALGTITTLNIWIVATALVAITYVLGLIVVKPWLPHNFYRTGPVPIILGSAVLIGAMTGALSNTVRNAVVLNEQAKISEELQAVGNREPFVNPPAEIKTENIKALHDVGAEVAMRMGGLCR